MLITGRAALFEIGNGFYLIIKLLLFDSDFLKFLPTLIRHQLFLRESLVNVQKLCLYTLSQTHIFTNLVIDKWSYLKEYLKAKFETS